MSTDATALNAWLQSHGGSLSEFDFEAIGEFLASEWLAAYVHTRLHAAEALAPTAELAAALEQEGGRLIAKYRDHHSPASEKRTAEGYALRRAANDLRRVISSIPEARIVLEGLSR